MYDDTTDSRKDATDYSTVEHSSSVQNDDYYDDAKIKKLNFKVVRKPTPCTLVYAVPNNREKLEKGKINWNSWSSIDFRYRPLRSPEMQVRSKEQTLSLIDSDNENKMKFDIYFGLGIPEQPNTT